MRLCPKAIVYFSNYKALEPEQFNIQSSKALDSRPQSKSSDFERSPMLSLATLTSMSTTNSSSRSSLCAFCFLAFSKLTMTPQPNSSDPLDTCREIETLLDYPPQLFYSNLGIGGKFYFESHCRGIGWSRWSLSGLENTQK